MYYYAQPKTTANEYDNESMYVDVYVRIAAAAVAYRSVVRLEWNICILI
jgi:hypothetical protein